MTKIYLFRSLETDLEPTYIEALNINEALKKYQHYASNTIEIYLPGDGEFNTKLNFNEPPENGEYMELKLVTYLDEGTTETFMVRRLVEVKHLTSTQMYEFFHHDGVRRRVNWVAPEGCKKHITEIFHGKTGILVTYYLERDIKVIEIPWEILILPLGEFLKESKRLFFLLKPDRLRNVKD